MNLLRHAVSKQKRRYVDKDAGLDLDLAYITPEIIAMGYPSRSLEAFYRNPMSEVEKFLDSRHEGKYKVYNLCSEKSYSDQRFHGRVAQFPFHDHCPPPFQLIHPFCEDVSDWLHTEHDHVVAVHCKAGKGRTGVMICSYLVHCGATAAEAIQWYGEKRTLDGCGVTIPSQIRYIQYYETFLEARTLHYDPRLLVLQEILIDTIPKPLSRLDPGSNYIILTIFSGDTKIYESLPRNSHVDTKRQQIRIQFPEKIVLAGDVKIMLWYDSAYKRCHLCHYFFNTTFISKDNILSLTKSETDKACKDKLHTIFDRDFKVHTRFAPAFSNQAPLHTLPEEATRSILLRYKNHQGPNTVQVRPPSFSTMRLTQRSRSSPWLKMFLQGGVGEEGNNAAGRSNESTATSTIDTTASSGTTISASSSISNHPPVLRIKSPPTLVQQNGSVFAPKASASIFRPSWGGAGGAAAVEKDRDDDWDTASISSDCSESDTATEWWYTKPPRMIFGGGNGNNGKNFKSKSPLSSPSNSRGRPSLENTVYGHVPTSPLASPTAPTGPTSPRSPTTIPSSFTDSTGTTTSPISSRDGPSLHPPASSVLQGRNEQQTPLLSVSRGNLSGAMCVSKTPPNSSGREVVGGSAGGYFTGTSISSSPPIVHYQPSHSPLANEIIFESPSLPPTREGSTLSEASMMMMGWDCVRRSSAAEAAVGGGNGGGEFVDLRGEEGDGGGSSIKQCNTSSTTLSSSLTTMGGTSSVYSEHTTVSRNSEPLSEPGGSGWVDTMSRWLWPSVSSTAVNEHGLVGDG